MRLANPPTYPGEIPAPNEMAGNISSANFCADTQEEERFHPFNLEIENAGDFFCLDAEQQESLTVDQKRGLTLLMWAIDTASEITSETLEFKKLEFNESMQRLGRFATPGEQLESMQPTQKEIDVEDQWFENTAKECIDLASILISGNSVIITLLSEEYGRQVQDDVHALYNWRWSLYRELHENKK